MAVVKSDLLTNQLNKVLNDQGQHKDLKTVSGVVTTTGAVADNGVLAFFEVPVDAFLDEVIFASDDLGTTGDLNVGFYPSISYLRGLGKTVDDLADTDAVDEDAIGTAIDVNAGAVSPTDIRFETKGIETINQRAWELAGLSGRPDYDKFIVAATASEATTAAGDVTLRVIYRL